VTRHDLPDKLYDTLKFMGGQGTIIEICMGSNRTKEEEKDESGRIQQERCLGNSLKYKCN